MAQVRPDGSVSLSAIPGYYRQQDGSFTAMSPTMAQNLAWLNMLYARAMTDPAAAAWGQTATPSVPSTAPTTAQQTNPVATVLQNKPVVQATENPKTPDANTVVATAADPKANAKAFLPNLIRGTQLARMLLKIFASPQVTVAPEIAQKPAGIKTLPSGSAPLGLPPGPPKLPVSPVSPNALPPSASAAVEANVGGVLPEAEKPKTINRPKISKQLNRLNYVDILRRNASPRSWLRGFKGAGKVSSLLLTALGLGALANNAFAKPSEQQITPEMQTVINNIINTKNVGKTLTASDEALQQPGFDPIDIITAPLAFGNSTATRAGSALWTLILGLLGETGGQRGWW